MYRQLANRAGYYLILVGVMSFVLPMFGWQFVVIDFLGGAGVASLLVFSIGVATLYFS